MSLNLDRSTWPRVHLGDVVKDLNETVREPGAVGIDRVIAMEHLDPGELKIVRWGEIADGTTFTRRVHPGQTLFGKRRAYQRKVAFADFDAICSGDILVFQSDPKRLLSQLLPFLVQSEGFFNHALQTSAGSLSPRTNWKDLSRYEFGLPALDQQQRIADLLWSVERNRQTSTAMALSNQQARSAMRDRLFDRESPTAVLQSVCSIPSQNGLSKPKDSRAGNVPMVNMGELFRDEVLRPADFERVHLEENELPKYILRDGDLLFARRSIVFEGAGLCCLVPPLEEPHTFESSIIRVTPKAELMCSEYLLHYFRSAVGRRRMGAIIRRGPVSGIAGSDLRKFEVSAPSLETQKAIVEQLHHFDQVTPALAESARAIGELRQGLVNEIFGGAA